jgi:hypothetical protein
MTISRPESRESYQEHYRNTVTSPKMALAERYLAEYQIPRDPSGIAMAAAVAQFKLASECPAQVVPHIHDLWAEYVFRSATTLDLGARPAFLADRFLKPLADFTDDERRFEEMLAIADLCTLANVIEGLIIHHFPMARKPMSATAAPAALRALARIAASDDLLAAAAKPIYDNWLKVRRLCDMGDPSDRPYEYLSDSNLQKLFMNIRADVLATLLFCAEDEVNWLEAEPCSIPSAGLVKDAGTQLIGPR